MARKASREHWKYLRNVVLWPITEKIRTCELATKPQTNWCSCLWFSFLAPDWLFSCNTVTFQNYFWCSQFSRFDRKTPLVPETFFRLREKWGITYHFTAKLQGCSWSCEQSHEHYAWLVNYSSLINREKQATKGMSFWGGSRIWRRGVRINARRRR